MTPNGTAGASGNPGFVDSTGSPLLKMPSEVRAGVTAVIFNDRGQVLLEHRSDNGWWGLPGGAVDIGESVSEAVLREVEEETGLTVTIRRLVGVYSDPALFTIAQYPDGNVVHYVGIVFECQRQHGELRISDESTDIAYFPIEGLPDKTTPGHRIRVQDALANSPEPFVK